MTTTKYTAEAAYSRAMWLGPVPPSVSETRAQRIRAKESAARAGAHVAAEFLYHGQDGGDLSDRGWQEVVEALTEHGIGALVVLSPDAIAAGFAYYYRRTEALETAGVRVVLPAGNGIALNAEAGDAREVA